MALGNQAVVGSPLDSMASLATGIWLNLQKGALILFYWKGLKSNLDALLCIEHKYHYHTFKDILPVGL